MLEPPANRLACLGMNIGDTIGARYRLVEQIGVGGSARVFRVDDLLTGETRALKLMHRVHESQRRRLHREARVMRELDHPNVLRVHDVGEHEGLDYIVMDLASGGSLATRLDQGPVAPPDALSWTLELLSALAAAHDVGIVHRDVKPCNVLLDDQERVLLADFGVALVSDATRHTREGGALGSLNFMAPEQRLDARAVDGRADLYAVGATLYALLTGRNPADLFAAGPGSARLSGLSPLIASTILRATRYAPADRYPDARRMAAAVAAAHAELHAQKEAAAHSDEAIEHAPLDAALRWLGPDFLVPGSGQGAPPPLAEAPRPGWQTSEPTIDETERLADLLATALLDTSVEERFDRHTRLARRLFDVPIALVSLVDRDRQWFKSRAGLDATETPRDVAFCAHAIRSPDHLFEVSDASQDPRFRDNPLVLQDPNIRFYAGYPIRGRNGQPVGTLCIIDRRPRQLEDADRALLRDLANTVESELVALESRSIDPETGLSNREGFVLAAQRLLGFGRRSGAPLRLVQLRVEAALEPPSPRAVALALREAWPDAEVLARLDADTFCVVTTELTHDQPAHDAMRARLGVPLRWTALSIDPTADEPLAALLGRADLSLNRHLEQRLPGSGVE